MRTRLALLGLLTIALALTGCGRKAPLEVPPGPTEPQGAAAR